MVVRLRKELPLKNKKEKKKNEERFTKSALNFKLRRQLVKKKRKMDSQRELRRLKLFFSIFKIEKLIIIIIIIIFYLDATNFF